MIDRKREELITLQEAASSLPAIEGRNVHWRTLYAWHWRGVKGVRLETLVVAGRRLTSREAIDRFIFKTTLAREPHGQEPQFTIPQTPRVSTRTKRRLAHHGIKL